MKTCRSIAAAALCLLLLAAAVAAIEIETISVTTTAVSGGNLSPIAEDLELRTYRGVSVAGRFQAIDPDGDPLRFRLCAEPVKGEVVLDGDSFIYTPADGKRGRDVFSYAAVDELGNVSAEATVTIRIGKQSTKVCYADLSGDGLGYAALRLAEEGIFTGEQLGRSYCFSPEQTLTRGDFLAMCASLSELRPLEGVSKTGFSDDERIVPWLKPYVSAALMSGAVRGSAADNGRILFRSEDIITRAEAAVMLDNFLELSETHGALIQGSDAPQWAAQAVANLTACDIVPGGYGSFDSGLTRGEAASMLSGALDVLENRRG